MPAGVRDTISLGQGIPNRVAIYDENVYVVTQSDADNFLHVVKWSENSVTDYSSVGQTPVLDGATTPAMIAAVQTDATLHISYLWDDGGTLYLRYLAFDMSTDEFTGNQEGIILVDSGSSLGVSCLQMVTGPSSSVHIAAWYRESTGLYSAGYYSRTSAGGIAPTLSSRS